MALIVDFVELEKKMYESFIQKISIQDSLVFTAEIQAELTRQFQQPNTRKVAKLLQEKWLARYHELIEFEKHNQSAAFMCGRKLGNWARRQRQQYTFFKEEKHNSMTAERIGLLDAIDFTWSPKLNIGK